MMKDDKFRDIFLDDDDRGIRSSDKLNYRVVIQDKINRYLDAIGTDRLEPAVNSLRNSVFFNIPGLPFRSEIMQKETQLFREYVFKVIYLVKTRRDEWIYPYKRNINDATFKEKYFMDLAVFLLELIAIHDGLMGVKGRVDLGVDEYISKNLYKKETLDSS